MAPPPIPKGLSDAMSPVLDPLQNHGNLIMAEAAQISRASAQRSVHTLQAMGLIQKQPSTRRFQLAPTTRTGASCVRRVTPRPGSAARPDARGDRRARSRRR